MTTLVHGLIDMLEDAVVKVTVLLALAAIVTICARRASASFRHFLWALGLGCALCLPLLSWNLPHWRVPVTIQPTHLRPAADKVTPNTDTAQVNFTPDKQPQSSVAPAEIPTMLSSSPAPPQKVMPESVRAASPAVQKPIAPAPAKPWRTWVLWVWVSGATLVMGRLAQGLIGVRRITGASEPITAGRIASELTEAANIMGVGLPIVLRQSSSSAQVTVPFTYGAFRPMLILPSAAQDWPEERLRAVLLHEMAHVRRHDWILQILAHIVCAFYWFHPLVWMAARKMRTESETACDDLVLSAGLSAKDYARHLLDVALSARQSRHVNYGAVAMAQTPRVEGRLRAILAQGLSRRPVTAMSATGFATIALLLVLPLASVRLSAQREAVSKAGKSEAAVALPTTAKVTLPNGVTVRLAGVADTQKLGRTYWWAADGSPVTAPVPKNTLVFPTLPAGTRGRAFAVTTTYDTAKQPKIIWATRPNFDWAYAQSGKGAALYYIKPNFTLWFEPDEHLQDLNHFQEQETGHGSNRVHMTVDPLCSRVSQKTVTLKYAVAAGRWTESVTCKKTPGKVTIKTASGDVIFTLVPNPHHLPPAQAAHGNARFMVSDHFRTPSPPLTMANSLQAALRRGENYDRDVVGLDSAGRVVMDLRGSVMTDPDGPSEDYSSVKTMQFTSIPNDRLKRIASFRLLARPFQWAEFHNVPLEPSVVALQRSVLASISNLTPDAAAAIVHVNLGRKAQEKGQPRDGIPEFRRAVALNPYNTDAQFLLAQALYQINDKRVGTTTYAHPAPPAVLDEAIQHMKKYVDMLPFDPASQSTLGTYLENRGRYTEAISYYKRALHLLVPSSGPSTVHPTHAETESAQQIFDNHWLLGDALLKIGRYREAVVHYQEALRFNPKAFWVLLGYGDALNKIGRHTEARAAWKKIITFEGVDNYYGQQARARLAKG